MTTQRASSAKGGHQEARTRAARRTLPVTLLPLACTLFAEESPLNRRVWDKADAMTPENARPCAGFGQALPWIEMARHGHSVIGDTDRLMQPLWFTEVRTTVPVVAEFLNGRNPVISRTIISARNDCLLGYVRTDAWDAFEGVAHPV